MIIITFALTGRHCITLRITLGAASLAQGYGQSLGFQLGGSKSALKARPIWETFKLSETRCTKR